MDTKVLKGVTLCIGIAVLVIVLGTSAFAGKPAPIPQLTISEVLIDFQSSIIHIYGSNFTNGNTPLVTLSGTQLAVNPSYTSSEIKATLPSPTPAAGDYLLAVATGTASAQYGSFDVTIGPTGGLNGVPAGTIVAFGGNKIPPGWLLCDGSAQHSAQYPALFAAIGTYWGNGTDGGDGTTDFNLPDLIGVFLRGKDWGWGRDPDRGSRVPNRTGGASGDEVGSWQNWATGGPWNAFTTDSQGSHYHTLPAFNDVWRHDSGTSGGIGEWTVGNRPGGPMTTSTDGAHGHTITGGGDSETRPRNASVNWIIKY